MKKAWKVPKEPFNKWIENLRSGKYNQGTCKLLKRGNTKNEDRYCCLGVLGSCIVNEDLMVGLGFLHELQHNTNCEQEDLLVIKSIVSLKNLNKDLIYEEILSSLNDSGIQDFEKKCHPDIKFLDKESGDRYTFEEIAQFLELNTETY